MEKEDIRKKSNSFESLDLCNNILSELKNQYLYIYVFDLETGDIIDLKDGRRFFMGEINCSLQQVFYCAISQFALLENVPKMKYFADLSTLSERLMKKKMISKIFHGKDRAWYNTKFIRLGKDEPIRYVMCTIENVDEQILSFKEERKEFQENCKLHSMMDAFIDEYSTVCSIDIITKRVEFSKLSERLKYSYALAKKIGNADELAEMFLAMAVHSEDYGRLRKVLTKEYIEKNIGIGNSFSFVFRNELNEFTEMRIFRNSENSVIFGFKNKNYEIEELNNQLYTDSLTGVKNRKYYDDKEASKKCKAVVISDIDYFKNINDTYGHQFGDSVLQVIASTLKKCLRKTDEVIRYGGDEFTISFEDITSDALSIILEKMRLEITNIVFPKYPDVHLSMSFGVAYGDGLVHEMLSCADDALYDAKRKRNTVIFNTYEKGKSYLKKTNEV